MLDTSAILAHWLNEPGAFQVEHILDGKEAFVASVTWFELRIKWQALEQLDELIDIYQDAVAGTVDVTEKITKCAFEIRRSTPGRIPTVDALIAGAAQIRGYKLVHRDPHLASIPASILTQTVLPSKESPK